MTIIDRLSPHTTIERDDTGAYMVTTSHEVAAAWRYVEGIEIACDDNDHMAEIREYLEEDAQ